MANIRVQVSNYTPDSLPADRAVNTLYFTGDLPSSDANWQTFLGAIITSFSSAGVLANSHFTATAYNMADSKPRPILATRNQVGGGDIAPGPHEVALCMSYYSARNLPSSRGRIYLGPLPGSVMGAQQPNSAYVTAVLGIATAIHTAAGAAALVWSLHSVKENNYQAITNVWVDNAWDTQRRRGIAATTRSKLAF